MKGKKTLLVSGFGLGVLILVALFWGHWKNHYRYPASEIEFRTFPTDKISLNQISLKFNKDVTFMKIDGELEDDIWFQEGERIYSLDLLKTTGTYSICQIDADNTKTILNATSDTGIFNAVKDSVTVPAGTIMPIETFFIFPIEGRTEGIIEGGIKMIFDLKQEGKNQSDDGFYIDEFECMFSLSYFVNGGDSISEITGGHFSLIGF